MTDAKKEYADIIDLPHHRSAKRQPMSLHDRAAQFAPFAALKGYDDELEETARLTDKRIELGDEELFELNEKTYMLLQNIEALPKVKLTFFVADESKEGGSYRTKAGALRRIDEVQRLFIFEDGVKIAVEDVIKIESEYFEK